ncbi:MAG: Asp-tRNA(Asn)/Glu-tRNA(Gln) amidotransferase subunit GatB [Phycisphaerae bacterium]|nr:Asp-tRNA(Asn)/Glu-tRNA(Gln) amidotransferase subunit GatB [Phycisphaerae bacterium]
MTELDGLDVEPIIGLEIHVQLATRTKLFCACPLMFGAEPNTATCPVCLGLPGALPVMNRAALEHAVRAALALNCRVAGFTKWDRKSYYYPDLPKNYQISQYDLPLSSDGYLEFPFGDSISKVRIIRAHLEEDAGKNVHDIPGISAIDLNRAGTPLLEIVTAPDLHSANEVRELAVQLQRLVRYLGVSEAVMQKGQMRFEPNINVRIRCNGQEFRTPIVEVKNLNSFRALHGAVNYEVTRQVAAWRKTGETAVSGNKSNRGWDDEREVTVPQREKEEAHDYRYFPDPDLVPVTFGTEWIKSVHEEMPELPLARTERFICEYKLSRQDAAALVDDRGTADLLDHAVEAGGDKLTLAKHFLSFWARHAHERGKTIAALGISPGRLAELANLVHRDQINATAAAQLAKAMLDRWDAPATLAAELGLLQNRDADQISAWVAAALEQNAQAVRDAIANPKKVKAARGFLTGQVMQLSGGQADPKIVGQLVEQKLGDIASQQ